MVEKELYVVSSATFADYAELLKIAEALFEIMLPRFSGDILPKSDAGIVLAVADR